MKKLVLALGIASSFLATGCGDGSDKLEAVKKKMCACTDAACAQEVTKELAGLKNDVKKTKGNEKLVMEITQCAMKAAKAGVGAAPAAPAE